jgi:hypothetical protein
MLSKKEYEEFLNHAKSLYAQGRNDRYVVLQLAEKKVSNEDIDAIMKEIKSLRKYNLRQRGVKEFLVGISFTIAGALIAYFVGYSVNYVAMALPIIGVIIATKGLFNILGL